MPIFLEAMEIFKITSLSIHVSQLAIHKSTLQLQLAVSPFLGANSCLALCDSLLPAKAVSNLKVCLSSILGSLCFALSSSEPNKH